jgi:hypothetical protein
MPWMGEGFLGGVQTTALESLKEATSAGEANARATFAAVAYERKQFVTLQTPVWAGLSAESRLSDVIVFTSDASRGRGPLAEAFQQMVADEQRPVLVARKGLEIGGVVAVAWDGGKEASRAARLATPLLEKASRVVIISAPKASSRTFDPVRLQGYYAARGVISEVQRRCRDGDPAGGGVSGRRDPRGRRLWPPSASGIHLWRNHPDTSQRGLAILVFISLNL